MMRAREKQCRQASWNVLGFSCIHTLEEMTENTARVEKSDVLLPAERVVQRSALPIGAACSRSARGFLSFKKERKDFLSSTFFTYL